MKKVPSVESVSSSLENMDIYEKPKEQSNEPDIYSELVECLKKNPSEVISKLQTKTKYQIMGQLGLKVKISVSATPKEDSQRSRYQTTIKIIKDFHQTLLEEYDARLLNNQESYQGEKKNFEKLLYYHKQGTRSGAGSTIFFYMAGECVSNIKADFEQTINIGKWEDFILSKMSGVSSSTITSYLNLYQNYFALKKFVTIANAKEKLNKSAKQILAFFKFMDGSGNTLDGVEVGDDEKFLKPDFWRIDEKVWKERVKLFELK